MRQGTTQKMRLLAALRPESAPLDERTIPDGLVFASKFSRLINFFNRDDRLDGDWSAFFDEQPIVQYALIRQIDVAGLAEYYASVIEQSLKDGAARRKAAEDVEHEPGVQMALSRLLAILRRANGWHRFFAGRPDEKGFFDAVDAAIRMGMGKAYAVGAGIIGRTATREPMPHGGQEWEKVRREWEKARQEFDPALWGAAGQSLAGAATGKDLKHLGKALWEAHHAEAGLVARAQARLDRLLAKPEGLDPHFALYLNFLRQYGCAQARLNALTGRHLDYYYKYILEESPLPPVPDRIYFALQTDPKRGRFTLPAGVGLTGKDAGGKAVVYQTDDPLDLSGAVLARISTVYLAGPTGDGPHFQIANVADSADLKAPPAPPVSWAPFGEPGATDAGAISPPASAPRPAEIGLAVASPYLHLEEGERSITITFTFDGRDAGKVAGSVPISPEFFHLSYSGPTDWVRLAKGGEGIGFVTCTANENDAGELSLVFAVTLAEGAPPCVNFDPARLTGPFAPDWPVVRVHFPNPLAAVCSRQETLTDDQHAAWKARFGDALCETPRISLAKITIAVGADNMSHLVLCNDSARIAPGPEMLLFGNQPRVGSSFCVGKPEIFRKKFSGVTIGLDWANLPNPEEYPKGLRSYYQEYADVIEGEGKPGLPPPGRLFANDEYQVTLARVTDRQRQDDPGPAKTNGGSHKNSPGLPGLTIGLFETGRFPAEVPSGAIRDGAPGRYYPTILVERLKTSTTYVIPDQETGRLASLASPGYPPGWTPQDGTGFFQIQLAGPGYAFGQQMYPQVAGAIAMRNARRLLQESAESSSPGSKGPSPLAAAIVDELKSPARSWGRQRYVLTDRIFAILQSEHTPSKALHEWSTSWLSNAQWVEAYPEFFNALLSLKGEKFSNREDLDRLIFDKLDKAIFSKFKSQLKWADKEAQELLLDIYLWFAELMELSLAETGDDTLEELPTPNPPLVPALRGVKLSYRAETVISLSGGSEPYCLYHITPMATYPVSPPLPGADAKRRLPTLIGNFSAGGYLYFGLANVSPPQNLSLLAIIEERPVAGFEEDADVPVWSFLTSGGWSPAITLPDAVDGTFGFQKTGLIRLTLPAGMSDATPFMPAGFFWVRAHAKQPGRAGRVLRLVPQAGSATWQIPGDASPATIETHLAMPLPAASIRAVVPLHPLIRTVEHPLPSLGGRPAETGDPFLVRVSERLRHKNRAWTPWDYERLLLQQYPEIYYALCLPCTKYPASGVPGHVLVLVLPVVASPPAKLPPGFTAGKLREMEAWLRERISPTVQVAVANPAWQTVCVNVAVTFAPDQPEEAYRAQLNDELKAYLSPWVFEQAGREAPPKVRFHPEEIRKFIRRRPYVKGLTGMKIRFSGGGADPIAVTGDDDWLSPSKPWNLLVTAEQHVITRPA